MVFAVLIGVNVYFFFLRGGTSLRALMKTTELAKHDPSAASAMVERGGGAARSRRRAKPKTDDPSAEEARVVEGDDGRQRHRRAAPGRATACRRRR